MDVLSDMLQTFRLRSSIFAMTELATPWGMSTTGIEDSIFHVILRGGGWLEVDGEPGTHVDAGDVVLVAPRQAHTLRDSPRSRARPIGQLLAEGAFAPGRRVATDRPTTLLMCGCFQVDDAGSSMLLAALPPVIHLREVPHAGAWLEHTVKLMSYEAARDRPGSSTIINRLCDALFVYVVRDVIESMATTNASWLRGLTDPKIGASLRLIHERPAEPWSVARLAGEVGLSRSGFALRFAELVGDSPMRYLTRWRLHKAIELMRTGEPSIAEVAARVGYDSESAFHKAFKRTLGVAPGAHRRDAQRPSPGAPDPRAGYTPGT
jgi:AraC-like DNA-binding protein